MIELPDTRLCKVVTEYARRASEPCLFNHVMRTFAFGTLATRGLPHDVEVFYVAALLHDLGLTPSAPRGVRFEIAGADAAKELLSREGMGDAEIEVVWDAIALHTVHGVPPRKRPEVMMVQLGAALDVGYVPFAMVAGKAKPILEKWPRLSFETEMVRYLEAHFDRDPSVALQSPIVADIVERRRGIRGPNACDVLSAWPGGQPVG